MTASTNINLKVPFVEKDQAKALGARWNAELKLWYVPQGLETAPFEKWLATSGSPSVVTKKAIKAPPATNHQTEFQEDDFDAINSQLRDAYEMPEVDGM